MAQPTLRPQDAVMLIPSLEPDDRLPAYVRRLLDKGFQHVVIVDDGSSAAYQPIFAELDAMDGVSVTHADCPDHLCVKQGKITSSAIPIACVPHHLTVQIEGTP